MYWTIGFREIVRFNQALLAKQGWRLLSSANALVSRMLKAKYFPRDNFLEAGIGSSPSYLWRSVLWGRELLKVGLRWGISNGRNTKVYLDPWAPGMEGFRVQAFDRADLTMSVSSLFIVFGGWDEQKLRRLFTLREVEAILNILVVQTVASDIMIWHYNKHGKYSVKSGY